MFVDKNVSISELLLGHFNNYNLQSIHHLFCDSKLYAFDITEGDSKLYTFFH